MLATEVPTCWLSADALVSAFYNSFIDEESFKGDEQTLAFAGEIVSRGDAMWNWPTTVADAEEFIQIWENEN